MSSKRKALKGYGALFNGDKPVAPTSNTTDNNTLYEGSIYQHDYRDRLGCVRYSEAWDYHLAQVDWAVFITFTWANRGKRSHSRAAHNKRKRDVFKFMTELSMRYRIRPRQLAYFAVDEYSFLQEGHFHVLVAKNKLGKAKELYRDTLMAPLDQDSEVELEQIICGYLVKDIEKNWKHGRCVAKAFDKEHYPNGHRYLLKIIAGEPEGAHDSDGEARKLGYDNIVLYPSHGLRHLLKNMPKNKDGYYISNEGGLKLPAQYKPFALETEGSSNWHESTYRPWLSKIKDKYAEQREMDEVFQDWLKSDDFNRAQYNDRSLSDVF